MSSLLQKKVFTLLAECRIRRKYSPSLTQEQTATGVHMYVWCLSPGRGWILSDRTWTQPPSNWLLQVCRRGKSTSCLPSFVWDAFRNINPTTSLLFPAEIPGCGANWAKWGPQRQHENQTHNDVHCLPELVLLMCLCGACTWRNSRGLFTFCLTGSILLWLQK